MKLITLFLLLLIGGILTHPALSLHYATLGLELWFSKMLPSLLPFTILSGILLRMQLTEKLSAVAYPLVRPLFGVRKNVCYCMLMGFLCGFPMGARVTADAYEERLITRREAEYLLAFCNQIGPVYFCSFVLPLLRRQLTLPYLLGMYGVPLLYGLVLRHTLFRDLSTKNHPSEDAPTASCELCACGEEGAAFRGSFLRQKGREASTPERLLSAINASVAASVQSILMLGGYMILFNLCNLLFALLPGKQLPLLAAPLLEITGGLMQLNDTLPLYSLLALSFGGCSCMAQTYSCISKTDLSVWDYMLHRILLTTCTGLFYLLWFLLSPASFLR